MARRKLSPQRLRILGQLERRYRRHRANPGTVAWVTMKSLAQRRKPGQTGTSVRRLVYALHDDGMVEIEVANGQQFVSITPTGLEALGQAVPLKDSPTVRHEPPVHSFRGAHVSEPCLDCGQGFRDRVHDGTAPGPGFFNHAGGFENQPPPPNQTEIRLRALEAKVDGLQRAKGDVEANQRHHGNEIGSLKDVQLRHGQRIRWLEAETYLTPGARPRDFIDTSLTAKPGEAVFDLAADGGMPIAPDRVLNPPEGIEPAQWVAEASDWVRAVAAYLVTYPARMKVLSDELSTHTHSMSTGPMWRPEEWRPEEDR